VHVEGRPDKEPTRAPARPQRAWVKAAMALLIRPDVLNAPYRTFAEHADVALGTIVACVKRPHFADKRNRLTKAAEVS
jgi:hypothetical protein